MDDKTRRRFESYLRLERNCAENTVKQYRRWIGRWCDWLDKHGVSWDRMEYEDAVEWWSEIKSSEYSTSYKSEALVSVRMLYRWAVRQRLVGSNPFDCFSAPKREHRIPDILSREDLSRMFAALNVDTAKDIRDYAILHTLYSTGCRVSELVGMDLQDINWTDEPPTVKVLGKGKKERVVMLYPKAATAIREYMRSTRREYSKRNHTTGRGRKQGRDSEALWLGLHGERINRQACYDAVVRAAKKARLDKHVHTHVLRHTCATHLVENGMDILYVSEYLGHSKLSTTQIYVRASGKNVKTQYQTAHPGMG